MDKFEITFSLLAFARLLITYEGNQSKGFIIKMKLLVSRMSKMFMVVFLLMIMSCSTIDYMSNGGNHLKTARSKNELSLLTYNIKAIYDKEEGQIDSLMRYINKEKFDFVLFQELFDESTRDEIIEKSDTSFYSTIISRVDYHSFPELLFQDAGLYMMASYPRIDLSAIEFGDDAKNSNGIVHMILDKEMSRTNDYLANKSIMGSLFAINDTTRLFLFNTHVQAIGTREHKLFQMKQIYAFINSTVTKVVESGIVNSSENLVVILAGDFNSNAYNPGSFRAMQNILGNPRDLHMEFNGNKQEYTWRFRSSSRPRRFDYILAYDSLSKNTLKKVDATSINTKDVKDGQNNSISDHKALKANIRLNM
jgi:endonuclease/exonuclease/phosphatase family metal-dependent hydrolase